jgi:hypothetical protein
LDEKKPDTKASGRIMPPAHPLSNHGAQVGATVLGFTVTAMADMAALTPGLSGAFAVLGKIACSAVISSF